MARISPYNLYFYVFMWLTLEYSEATLIWPAGTYGVPKANVGCPVSINFVWATGWRYEDTEDDEDDSPSNYISPSFHLDTRVGLDINRTFCIKNKDIVIEKAGDWPQGQYCIYKKGDCPKGLEEGYVFWHDEDDKNINEKGGTLPDGVYDKNTLIKFCCRTDGDKLKPIPLPLISPFYLKAFNTSECQRVEGAISTEEYIRYDNEDDDNQDRQNGSYPYGAGIHKHKIAYCYYESCLYTYSLDNDEQVQFTSPKFFGEGFPFAQECIWRFVAPEKEKVHITFLETHLVGDDSIVVSEDWNGGSALGSIAHDDPANPNGYSSQTNFILVKFNSKSRKPKGKPPKGFRGTFKIISSKVPPGPRWPIGTFGLPRPRVGCPPSDETEWKTGWRFQDTEDDNPSNMVSESFHMDATVHKNDLNRSFCITTQKKGPEWPKGQYCIYKKGACPKRLSEGYIFFDDENHKNQNKMGGTLPDGIYNKDTNISYCCRTDGDKFKPITLPVKNPFYLLAYNTSECQKVNGAIATKEYIRYHNQDTDNRDEMHGTYPRVQGKVNMTIAYCYYQACHFTMSEKPQEFMSPNYLSDGYPNSQICSWRFLIQKKKTKTEQILIRFPEFHLKKGGDGDVVRIYNGWNETAALLAEFNGDHPPPAKGVVSDSTVVYVVFKSDSQGRSRGFRGVFLNQTYNANSVPTRPITIPVKTTQPTTEKTTRATTSNTSTASLHQTTKKSSSPTPGKQSSHITIVVPVVIAVLIVTAMVCVYCVRRKRLEQRVKKTLRQSHVGEGNNKASYTYRDLDTQEYDSTEEIQDIFPSS